MNDSFSHWENDYIKWLSDEDSFQIQITLPKPKSFISQLTSSIESVNAKLDELLLYLYSKGKI